MTLKYIFHLSDIHIRNGDNINSRYEEYNTVFNNTIISINEQINIMKLNFDDFIIQFLACRPPFSKAPEHLVYLE